MLHLGLSHAVEMQVPPVGHVRQQVAVVDRVAVQMHTLGLDQQDDIWRRSSNVSEKENRDEKQRQTLTIQQVFRELLQNVLHAQGVSAIEAMKQVLCQFGAAFIVSAVNSLNKQDGGVISRTETGSKDRLRIRILPREQRIPSGVEASLSWRRAWT